MQKDFDNITEMIFTDFAAFLGKLPLLSAPLYNKLFKIAIWSCAHLLCFFVGWFTALETDVCDLFSCDVCKEKVFSFFSVSQSCMLLLYVIFSWWAPGTQGRGNNDT